MASQYPVPNSVDKLTARDAGAAIAQRVHIALGADGAYHFYENREDEAPLAFMVKGADGAYHLNDDDVGARSPMYFPGTETVTL